MNDSYPCNPPPDAPADYCSKLSSGISRLKQQLLAFYETRFPEGREWIQRIVAEAEASAWQTPFPSLFFLPLAHSRITEAQAQFIRPLLPAN